MNNNENDNILDILGAIELPNNILETKKDDLKKNKIITIKFSFFIKFNNKQKTENIIISKVKKEYKVLKEILKTAVFWIKYIITSAFIFWILLLTTNFSAYSNIIQSYIFKDQNKQESISLLSSVNAGKITENNILDKKEDNNNKNENIINLKTEHSTKNFSIKKILTKNNNDNIDLDINIVPYENRIVIPKIGKSIPLVDIVETTVESKNKLENILMKELEFGIVRYPWTAKPGEKWNSFIFGHSSNFPWIAGDYNEVFSRLWQMQKWDIVFSYYGQKKYKYKITWKKIVKPTDVGVLKNDKNKKQLTLMTCWPIGTTLNRLIVVAELVE